MRVRTAIIVGLVLGAGLAGISSCQGTRSQGVPPILGPLGSASAAPSGSASASSGAPATATPAASTSGPAGMLPGATNAVPFDFAPVVTPAGGMPPVPALSGRDLVIVGGHGYYYHDTYGWTTQRGVTNGLIEDIHTQEIVMDWLLPDLQRAGARVFTTRCPDRNPHEIVIDARPGTAGYTETGSFTDDGGGFGGSLARTAMTAAGAADAIATFEPVFPAAGVYTVWVRFSAGSDRAPDARFMVRHSGGLCERRVDQRVDSDRWICLDRFHFSGTGGEGVALVNTSSRVPARIAIDGVRFGGGMGDIARGGRTSGQPRWKEASRYWLQTVGAPPSLYDASSSDLYDDRHARGLYPGWQGADLYFSVHTNAGGGSGTSTYVGDQSYTAGSDVLQAAVHREVVRTIRHHFDPAWTDRGLHRADFTMFTRIQNVPAALIEVAFHDLATPDAAFLKDDRFRRDVARACAKGIIRSFDPAAAAPPPAPQALRVRALSTGTLRVEWEDAPDPLEPGAVPAGYRVQVSPDGLGFDDGTYVTHRTCDVSNLPATGPVHVRVAAVNGSGESAPTEGLAARPGLDPTRILVVSAFDRLDAQVTYRDGVQTGRAVVPHAAALSEAASGAYGFDSATNEAVERDLVALTDYDIVIWVLGRESVADETFSALEQPRVEAFLRAGGGLWATGAEIAWDLGARGGLTDQQFLAADLGATYVRDSSGIDRVEAAAGGPFAAVSPFAFGRTTYAVPYPDVIAPATGAAAVLHYAGTAEAAATAFQPPAGGKVLLFGFPFETIDDPAARREIVEKVLTFLR